MENRTAMNYLMQLLRKQGCFWSIASPRLPAMGHVAGQAANVPTVRGYTFLDDVHSPGKVCER